MFDSQAAGEPQPKSQPVASTAETNMKAAAASRLAKKAALHLKDGDKLLTNVLAKAAVQGKGPGYAAKLNHEAAVRQRALKLVQAFNKAGL